jgi:hypothetical protein
MDSLYEFMGSFGFYLKTGVLIDSARSQAAARAGKTPDECDRSTQADHTGEHDEPGLHLSLGLVSACVGREYTAKGTAFVPRKRLVPAQHHYLSFCAVRVVSALLQCKAEPLWIAPDGPWEARSPRRSFHQGISAH